MVRARVETVTRALIRRIDGVIRRPLPVSSGARMLTSTACEMVAWSWGRSAFTRSAVSITFAPGWRCTLRMMARSRFAQPASWLFSTPS